VPIFFGKGVIQMRTSALFVAKTNIKFFKIYSVSKSDINRGGGGGEGLSQYLHVFGQRKVSFS